MRSFRALFAFGTVVLAMSALAVNQLPARADLKVVQVTAVSSPELEADLRKLPPAERAALASAGTKTVTLYIKGAKTRADIGGLSFLPDAAARQVKIVNHATRSYTVERDEPPRTQRASGRKGLIIKATGQSKTILGRRARHYRLRSPSGNLTGEIWSVPDLPRGPENTQQHPILYDLWGQVKGMPLRVKLVVKDSPIGRMTVTYAVTSLSTAPLPPSIFAVPRGYRRAP